MRSFRRFQVILASCVCVRALHVYAPLPNCDLPFQPPQEPTCKTGTELMRRLAMHNFRFKSTGTRPGVLERAVVGVRYSAPGSPGRSYHRQSLWAETHCAAEFFCLHHGRKEAFSPVRVCSSNSMDRSIQAGRAGRHALACSFFSCCRARSLY